MDGATLLGVVSFHDVAKAVYEEQSFENRMLKSYIGDSPTRRPLVTAESAASQDEDRRAFREARRSSPLPARLPCARSMVSLGSVRSAATHTTVPGRSVSPRAAIIAALR